MDRAGSQAILAKFRSAECVGYREIREGSDLTYHLEFDGAWKRIHVALKSLPDCAEVVWITYSVTVAERGAAKKVLDYLASRRFRVRIVCCHPGGGVALQRATVETVLGYAARGSPIRLRGYPAQGGPEYEDSEDVGRLHAKLLLARYPHHSGYRHVALHGSFNFADRSFLGNAEQVSDFADVEEGNWAEAHELWEASEPLDITHCTDSAGSRSATRADPAPIVDGPNTMPRRVASITIASPPPIPQAAPALLKKVAEVLDEMLRDYPGQRSALRGFQLAQLQRLERDKHKRHGRNLLYLPVGTGKSFVAFRWLIQRLMEAGQTPARAVFLVPNRWMQQTIKGDLASVAEKAGVNAAALEDLIRVLRPSALRDPAIAEVAGIIADECHNWNPTGSATLPAWASYTSALNWLTKTHPGALQVGLSATPCRMELGRFLVPAFIRQFVRDDTAQTTEFWGLKLSEAIAGDLLVPPRYEVIAKDMQPAIEEILLSARGDLIKMGDYADVVLREVWERLDRVRGDLVADIVSWIRRTQRVRVVVYLPPVAEQGDAFVRELRRRVKESFPGGEIWDARTRGDDSHASAFEDFRSFNASPTCPAVLVGIDRFREGISVPSIDMLVMLRATLSPRVAVQALGRGLRLARGKTDCVVLDAVQFKRRLDKWDESGQSAPASEGSVRGSGANTDVERDERAGSRTARGIKVYFDGKTATYFAQRDRDGKECLRFRGAWWSPSGAAGQLRPYAVNGRKEWKDVAGRSINELSAKAKSR